MIFKRLLWIGIAATPIFGFVLLARAAPGGPLSQVIEGAKKEGTVTAVLSDRFTAKSMGRLEAEIKKKFGVDLTVKFMPTTGMPQDLAQAMMEHKTGATPSYDLMSFSSQVMEGMKAGIFEKVDWKSLITMETNPATVVEHPILQGAIVSYTGYQGLMYNPKKVPADKVPKTLAELSDPKWKGQTGILGYTTAWARWAYILGKQRVLSDLRSLLKNGAIRGRYMDLNNRYLLDEISLAFTESNNYKMALDKGMPAAWQCLDYADVREYFLVVRKAAKHLNAAKLVAIYLASPEGTKFTLEESNAGNLYYSGNYVHDISLVNKKQGIREVLSERALDVLEFYATKEWAEWQKEIQLILDTGGQR